MVEPKNIEAAILYWETVAYTIEIEIEELAEDATIEDLQTTHDGMIYACKRLTIAEQTIEQLTKILDKRIMEEKNKEFYNLDRNLDPNKGLNRVMCGKGSCKCPSIQIHEESDVVMLGGKEEGFSSWTKEQFKMLADQIKNGDYDEYI